MAQTQQPKNLEEALKVIQQLTKMIEHQNQLIEQMNVALQLQQHRRFSKKNEAMNPDQLSLFEDESAKITRVSIILCTFENPSLYEMLT